MARVARFKIQNDHAWYHLYSRVAGRRGDYPLSDEASTRKLIGLIKHFSGVYFAEIASFCVMGDHYNLIAGFEAPWEVEEDELRVRARLMYPGDVSQRQIDGWPKQKWERFRERLFDVSELMRNIQSAFALWYNRKTDRRGRFWGGRFKSVCLENEAAVLDCMLDVELNPVRARLVDRPEDWSGSSIFLREIGKDAWLMPLSKILVQESEKEALIAFRERIYHRGSVPTKPEQAIISPEVLNQDSMALSPDTGDISFREERKIHGRTQNREVAQYALVFPEDQA